ncbi:MAG: hypothetical protein IJZ51_00190 [Ruminiclostridium sp.]|nr:hypothetical protein [Ruminiclostridium sp.]
MKRGKRIFKTMLILALTVAIAISSTGCLTVINNLNVRRELATELQKKYGENFIVHEAIYQLDSFIYDNSQYDCWCSPATNPEIIFSCIFDNRDASFADNYPESVISYLIKKETEKGFAELCGDSPIAVDVTLKWNYDDERGWEHISSIAPFTKASEITIKSYSEKYLEAKIFTVDIIVEKKQDAVDITALEKYINSHFEDSFYKIPINYRIRYTDKEHIERAKKQIADYSPYRDLEYVMAGEYPIIWFQYDKSNEYKFTYIEEESELTKPPKERSEFFNMEYVYNLEKADQEKLLELFDIKIPESQKDAYVFSFGFKEDDWETYNRDYHFDCFVIDFENVDSNKEFILHNSYRKEKFGNDSLSWNEECGTYHPSSDYHKYDEESIVTYRMKFYKKKLSGVRLTTDDERYKELYELFQNIKSRE